MDVEMDAIKSEQISVNSEMDEVKTTVLKNMTLIEPVNLISSAELMLIENSDGNLEINTIRTFEEHRDDEAEEIPVEQDNDEINDEFIEDDSLIDLMSNNAPEEGMSEEDEPLTEDDYNNDPTYFDKPEELAVQKVEESNPCTLCDREFKTAATLKRHVIVCHAVEEEQDDPLTFQLCLCCGEPVDSAHTFGDFKCLLCEKLFFTQTSLERHKSIEHSTGNIWSCPECNDTFEERTLLLEHMQTHPLTKVFSCRQCNREFTRKYHLDRHVAQTGCDGTPRNQFQCQVCQKIFSRKDNLRDHLRGHAGETKQKKLIECQYCQKSFRGTAMLVMHLRTHTGERPYACDLCPKRFPSSGAMKKHRRMHTGEKPYECPKCSNKFAAKETLNRHIRTHTGDRPHACQFCGKSFIQATQLRAHIFHHTGENAFTCTYCNRAFNRRTRLTTHVKFVHEGAKPLECDQCDKTFFRKEDLARHIKLHSGLKPFECDTCHKRFSIKSSLKIHMLTHRKERPCSCDECGRAFIRQDCLLRHMRAKHRDVLEDIMAGAEKKRLQQQLLTAASNAAKNGNKILAEHTIWNELTLTDSVKELLTLLVDESTLESIGWPNAPVDKLLDAVIKRCGHKPASEEDFDYIGRMRENAKLLFTVVIDDEAVKSLLNNQTVDEVILHVLKLAKSE
ncbi:hypothetical protein RN001_000977 [Aquatica leii]|uniref:C2H2-type domain-containing protein n=1 Tax=Aquatica leii TaxID=1421715 RepID=A0AAN7PMY7_9COLE|nr:hypothetical protein RN001_000977 [Aquatica leii]